MILVTGGSGMVGSSLKKYLPNALYPSSKELNLTSESSIKEYFNKHKIDSIIHLAAYVGSLHDNIENRVKYFNENIIMNTLLTKNAFDFGIKKFIGVLSTCIYPDKGMIYPMSENVMHNGAPHEDLYSYAYSKRSHAVQLDAYKKQYGLDYSYLIPTNMYGKTNHTERLHFINDLVLKIVQAKKENLDHIELFGDGTPLRQFMLADDFARFIFEYYKSGISISMNVGDEENRSIIDMAKIAIEISGKDLAIKFNNSKPNGQIRKDVDMALLNTNFPNFKFTRFEDGLKELFKFYEKTF